MSIQTHRSSRYDLEFPWQEGDGSRPRYIDIGPHGGYRSTDRTPHHQRLIESDIVAFDGNDMKVRTSDSSPLNDLLCGEACESSAESWVNSSGRRNASGARSCSADI